ncbi:hypothetical protein C446_15081 [Halobiforma nitratireducens JCM 10879]|uniref:Uncharacterized protein n=1 Tax=Halobiforma nitratireducens JCM 10879 TaxID=1227454 RepID=M0LHH6_9EURY|nr:hypothetical protein C446_15081 [Halobiforma nitratireducens JCM 10879]
MLHCSIQSRRIEDKIRSDAESAADRPEDFDFFIFATTTQMAGVTRDRLEDDLASEYEWRVHIKDFARLRKDLMDVENHDLAQEHLNVDPSNALDNPENDIEELYQAQISRLQERRPRHGELVEDQPIVAVHIFPVESVSDPPEMIATDLPEPPKFRSRSAGAQGFGDLVVTAPYTDLSEGLFSEYICLDGDGWVEAVTTKLVIERSERQGIAWYIDKEIVELVGRVCEMYQDSGFFPPVYVYITLIDSGCYTIEKPQRLIGPDVTRPINEDLLQLKRVKIEDLESDIALTLREPLYQLWNRVGWQHGSIHYSQNDDDSFEWDPYEA